MIANEIGWQIRFDLHQTCAYPQYRSIENQFIIVVENTCMFIARSTLRLNVRDLQANEFTASDKLLNLRRVEVSLPSMRQLLHGFNVFVLAQKNYVSIKWLRKSVLWNVQALFTFA